ncbi:MAG: diguanylate cyclase, partial [Candidatus Omnitrophica bacterium]|nr:diguanylate cyclase [Candidatus Omnitrophota bacterium]
MFKRIISSILICTFLVTNCDMGLALSPTSRCKPIVEVSSKPDGSFEIKDNFNNDDPEQKIKKDFIFGYLSCLLGEALYKQRDLRLSESGLEELVKQIEDDKKLPAIDYHDLADPKKHVFNWRLSDKDHPGIYIKDRSIYLPYLREDESLTLRYFIPGDGEVRPDMTFNLGDGRLVGVEVIEGAKQCAVLADEVSSLRAKNRFLRMVNDKIKKMEAAFKSAGDSITDEDIAHIELMTIEEIFGWDCYKYVLTMNTWILSCIDQEGVEIDSSYRKYPRRPKDNCEKQYIVDSLEAYFKEKNTQKRIELVKRLQNEYPGWIVERNRLKGIYIRDRRKMPRGFGPTPENYAKDVEKYGTEEVNQMFFWFVYNEKRREIELYQPIDWNREKKERCEPMSDLTDEQKRDIADIFSDIENCSTLRREHIDTVRNLNIDQRTGAYNQSISHQILKQEIARAREYGQPLSIILMDMDNLKLVNDRYKDYGPGDEALRTIVSRSKPLLRPSDKICRKGGDEFFIILWGTDEKNAESVARRLKASISEKDVTFEDESTKKRIEFPISVSMGVAQLEEDMNDKDLIRVATGNMYKAKPAKPMPPGSPHVIFNVLREEFKDEAAAAKQIQKKLVHQGYKELSIKHTISRDLGTLFFLNLVEKTGKGATAKYKAVNLSPPEWQAIEPILKGLGARPTSEEKIVARSMIAAIRNKNLQTRIVPVPKDIMTSYKEYRVFTREFHAEFKEKNGALEDSFLNMDPSGEGTYFPSPHWLIASFLKYIGVIEKDNLLEVGSANGGLSRFISRHFGIKSTAVEVWKPFHDYAVFLNDRFIEKDLMPEGLVTLVNKDFRDSAVNFADYSLIYYFSLGTNSTLELYQKMLQAKPGARIMIFGAYEPEIETRLAAHPDFIVDELCMEHSAAKMSARVYTRTGPSRVPAMPANPAVHRDASEERDRAESEFFGAAMGQLPDYVKSEDLLFIYFERLKYANDVFKQLLRHLAGPEFDAALDVLLAVIHDAERFVEICRKDKENFGSIKKVLGALRDSYLDVDKNRPGLKKACSQIKEACDETITALAKGITQGRGLSRGSIPGKIMPDFRARDKDAGNDKRADKSIDIPEIEINGISMSVLHDHPYIWPRAGENDIPATAIQIWNEEVDPVWGINLTPEIWEKLSEFADKKEKDGGFRSKGGSDHPDSPLRHAWDILRKALVNAVKERYPKLWDNVSKKINVEELVCDMWPRHTIEQLENFEIANKHSEKVKKMVETQMDQDGRSDIADLLIKILLTADIAVYIEHWLYNESRGQRLGQPNCFTMPFTILSVFLEYKGKNDPTLAMRAFINRFKKLKEKFQFPLGKDAKQLRVTVLPDSQWNDDGESTLDGANIKIRESVFMKYIISGDVDRLIKLVEIKIEESSKNRNVQRKNGKKRAKHPAFTLLGAVSPWALPVLAIATVLNDVIYAIVNDARFYQSLLNKHPRIAMALKNLFYRQYLPDIVSKPIRRLAISFANRLADIKITFRSPIARLELAGTSQQIPTFQWPIVFEDRKVQGQGSRGKGQSASQGDDKRMPADDEQKIMDVLNACPALLDYVTIAQRTGLSKKRAKSIINKLVKAGKVVDINGWNMVRREPTSASPYQDNAVAIINDLKVISRLSEDTFGFYYTGIEWFVKLFRIYRGLHPNLKDNVTSKEVMGYIKKFDAIKDRYRDNTDSLASVWLKKIVFKDEGELKTTILAFKKDILAAFNIAVEMARLLDEINRIDLKGLLLSQEEENGLGDSIQQSIFLTQNYIKVMVPIAKAIENELGIRVPPSLKLPPPPRLRRTGRRTGKGQGTRDIRDFHAHSDYSDGLLSPTELARYAAEEGVSQLALTDHDAIDGLDEAKKAAQQLGIDFITGVELTSRFHDKLIHILGYGFDLSKARQDRAFMDYLRKVKEADHKWAWQMCEKSQEYPILLTTEDGIEQKIFVTKDEIEEIKGTIPTSFHLSLILSRKLSKISEELTIPARHIRYIFLRRLEGGDEDEPIVSELLEKYKPIFEKYKLRIPHRGCWAVQRPIRHLLNAQDVVNTILCIGGIPVLAHPGEQNLNEEETTEIVKMGIKGMEIYSYKHKPDVAQFYNGIAQKHNLFVTSGSDFHDPFSRTKLRVGKDKEGKPLIGGVSIKDFKTMGADKNRDSVHFSSDAGMRKADLRRSEEGADKRVQGQGIRGKSKGVKEKAASGSAEEYTWPRGKEGEVSPEILRLWNEEVEPIWDETLTPQTWILLQEYGWSKHREMGLPDDTAPANSPARHAWDILRRSLINTVRKSYPDLWQSVSGVISIENNIFDMYEFGDGTARFKAVETNLDIAEEKAKAQLAKNGASDIVELARYITFTAVTAKYEMWIYQHTRGIEKGGYPNCFTGPLENFASICQLVEDEIFDKGWAAIEKIYNSIIEWNNKSGKKIWYKIVSDSLWQAKEDVANEDGCIKIKANTYMKHVMSGDAAHLLKMIFDVAETKPKASNARTRTSDFRARDRDKGNNKQADDILAVEDEQPFHVHISDQHDDYYIWLKLMIREGRIKKGLPLMLFDFHSDTLGTSKKINAANWSYHALKNGDISEIIWVVPRWVKNRWLFNAELMRARNEGLKISCCFPDELPTINGEVLVSIDFDFLSLGYLPQVDLLGEQTNVHKATEEEIADSVKQIFSILGERTDNIVAFGLSRTFEPYTYSAQVPFMEEAIKSQIEQYGNKRVKGQGTSDQGKGLRVKGKESGDGPAALSTDSSADSSAVANLDQTHPQAKAEAERARDEERSLPVPLPGKDDILCATSDLKKVFVGGGTAIARRFQGLLGKSPQENVTKTLGKGDDKVVFFTRSTKTGVSRWAFKLDDADRVAKLFALKRRQGLVAPIGAGEVICAARPLNRIFVGGGHNLATAVQERLGECPEKNATKTIEEGNIEVTFFTRKHGQHTIWAFRQEDSELVAKLFGFTLKEKRLEISPLAENEAACSVNELRNIFIGTPADMASYLRGQLGECPEENAIKIIGEGAVKAAFFTRRIEGNVLWAFKLDDAGRVANILGVKLRISKIPLLGKDEMACIGTQLEEIFVGMGKRLDKLLNQKLGECPDDFSTKVLVREGIQASFFTRRTPWGATEWAFKRVDAEAVANLFNLRLRDAEIPLIAEDEVPCTLEGLQRVFVANSQKVSLRLREWLGEFPHGKVTRTVGKGANKVTFLARRRREGFGWVIWAFKYSDASKLARLLEVPLRIGDDTRLEELGLTDAIAVLKDDPLRLQQYIRIYHPELSQEEVDGLVSIALRGLRAEWTEAEELHRGYTSVLPTPNVNAEVPETMSTQAHAFFVKGRVNPGIPYVQLIGAYTRRIIVQSDGTFSANIPLPRTGEINEFQIYAVNPQTRQKSAEIILRIRQDGVKEDTEEAFLKLLSLREDVLKAIKADSARFRFLLRAVEQSFLKHFTYDEAKGIEALRVRIEKERSPALKTILQAIIEKFDRIRQMPFNFKPNQKLYFFQKYTISEVNALIEQGARGVIIANEQGLGKTITALAFLKGKEAVIITPNSVVTTWIEQEEKFIPNPTIEILEGPHPEREETLTSLKLPQVVTNMEFARGMTPKRKDLLSGPDKILVVDEADYLCTLSSQQSQGTRQLEAKEKVLLTATPFKRISDIGNLLSFIKPEDPRFHSPRAFAAAFPANSTEALNALFLLLQEQTIRIRKRDVFEEYDPSISLDAQSDRLPRKIEIAPCDENSGQFYLSDEQSRSILELFTDYRSWCRKHRPNPSTEDMRYYRYKEGYFPKREALRQIMNDPGYIGRPELESPKHLAMDRIVHQELDADPRRKMLVFCRYRAQVEKYLKRYGRYGARSFYGGLRADANGYKVDDNGNVLYYKVDDYKNFILDEKGVPIPADKATGRPIRALDYEKCLFQNSPASRILIATYDTGALGVTFTSADVVVYDDLAQTHRDQYQAGDRAHRIDNDRKKYNVKYYWMQALYPKSFLDGIDPETKGTYFDVGTYDEVHLKNLKRQGRIFHRIMDGVGSDEELREANQLFMREHMPFLFERDEHGEPSVQATASGQRPKSDFRVPDRDKGNDKRADGKKNLSQKGTSPSSLRWLNEHREELGNNSLGYLVQALSIAGRIPEGENPEVWRWHA